MNVILYILIGVGIMAVLSVAVILGYVYLHGGNKGVQDARIDNNITLGVSARGTAAGAVTCGEPMSFNFFDIKNIDGGFNDQTCVYTVQLDGMYHVYAEMFIYQIENNTSTGVAMTINDSVIDDSIINYDKVYGGDYIFNKKIELKKGDKIGLKFSCNGEKINMERLKFIVKY